MTILQKEQIKQMRKDGLSYAHISLVLELSENTVKSFCRRNNLGSAHAKVPVLSERIFCSQCKKPLAQRIGAKKKRFCSDKCRMSWWNAHPEAVKHKTINTFICEACGLTFESYGKRQRKYCSRACYGQSKVVRHE